MRIGNKLITAKTEKEIMEKNGGQQVFQKSHGDLYVDGSCRWPTDAAAARASWAAVQINTEGNILAAAQGTIGADFRQAAVEGEQHAVLFGMGAAEQGVTLQCDCASVLRHARQPYKQAAGPRRRFAGYRRERATATQSRGLKHGLSKVKAHRTKQAIAAMGAEEAHHTAGNSTVDGLAKEACGWHQTAVDTRNAVAKAT